MGAMPEENHNYNILEDLLPLLHPIDKLELLPGNPRSGNVESVMASYRQFGQRKPIVARLRKGSEIGEVLAGNTQLKAARKLGWTHIAVAWTEDDDVTAAGYALADNRTSDLGEYLDEELAAMITMVEDHEEILDATGYDLMDLEDIMARIAGDDPDFDLDLDDDDFNPNEGEPEEPKQKQSPRPVIQYAIIFDSEEQQQRWFAFVRWLKTQYPDGETMAERLDAFLSGLSFDND